MVSHDNLTEYYSKRVNEYDRIYDKPERQADLIQAQEIISKAFLHHHVLELACGTGYWTPYIAQQAQAVVATDVNLTVLKKAKELCQHLDHVHFQPLDIFQPQPLTAKFDGCFAGFLWSHITLDNLSTFLENTHRCLSPGAKVMLMDNRNIKGSNTPICHTDTAGNTYQERHLADGSTYTILKNFPTPEFLKATLAGYGRDLSITSLPYFWIATYLYNP